MRAASRIAALANTTSRRRPLSATAMPFASSGPFGQELRHAARGLYSLLLRNQRDHLFGCRLELGRLRPSLVQCFLSPHERQHCHCEYPRVLPLVDGSLAL